MTGLIRMENVSFRYKHDYTIEDICLDIDDKVLTILKGSNASGKTTLSKLMTGILKPQKGRVLVNGHDTRHIALGRIGQQIGYLFQEIERQLFATTVREEISFPMKLRGQTQKKADDMVDRMLSLFSISHLTDRFPFSLSMGEKQRLALAAILANEPKFLLLDEPSAYLDDEGKYLLKEILKDEVKKGTGILVISHDPGILSENAERQIEMKRGKIVHDTESI